MHIIGYARSGREFETRDALTAGGYTVTVPRRIEIVSRGTKRAAKIEDAPFLRNYLFIVATAEQYQAMIRDLGKYKYLASTFRFVPDRLAPALARWVDQVEREAQRELTRHQSGEDLCKYREGDALRITEGPFAEWLDGEDVAFRRMVHAPSTHPMAEVEVQMFGRSTRVMVDPLHVKRG